MLAGGFLPALPGYHDLVVRQPPHAPRRLAGTVPSLSAAIARPGRGLAGGVRSPAAGKSPAVLVAPRPQRTSRPPHLRQLRPARAVPLAALPPTIPLVPPSCLAARSIRRLCWPPEQAAAAMSSVMISCTHSTSSFHRRSSINKEHVPSPPVSRRRSDSRRCRHVLPTMSSSTRSPPSSLPLAQPNRIAGSPVRPLQSLARNGSCPPLRHGHRTRGERQMRYR